MNKQDIDTDALEPDRSFYHFDADTTKEDFIAFIKTWQTIEAMKAIARAEEHE